MSGQKSSSTFLQQGLFVRSTFWHAWTAKTRREIFRWTLLRTWDIYILVLGMHSTKPLAPKFHDPLYIMHDFPFVYLSSINIHALPCMNPSNQTFLMFLRLQLSSLHHSYVDELLLPHCRTLVKREASSNQKNYGSSLYTQIYQTFIKDQIHKSMKVLDWRYFDRQLGFATVQCRKISHPACWPNIATYLPLKEQITSQPHDSTSSITQEREN